MKIKQIMTKKVVSAGPNTAVTAVAILMAKSGLHGIPVEAKGKLLGIITETDFFAKNLANFFLPTYIQFLDKAEFAKSLSASQRQLFKALAKARARDIMTKKCVTVQPESTVNDLIKLFRTKKVYTIPVVNPFGRLVGIVSQADLIKRMKKLA